MRRGPGLVAFDREAASDDYFASLSQEWNGAKLVELKEQIDQFATALRTFAVAHRQDIRRDPVFRHAFQRMCASLWVDPLAGHPTTTGKGGRLGKVANIWNELIGFGDWQYELGVQIVDVCISTRSQNGGIIAMDDLIEGVIRLRRGRFASISAPDTSETRITAQDIERSIQALGPLGCGYEVFTLGGTQLVRHIPRSLSTETLRILELFSDSQKLETDVQNITYATPSSVSHALGGTDLSSETQAARVLDDMLLNDGTLWLDIIPSDLSYIPEQKRRRYYSLSLAEKALRTPAPVLDSRIT